MIGWGLKSHCRRPPCLVAEISAVALHAAVLSDAMIIEGDGPSMPAMAHLITELHNVGHVFAADLCAHGYDGRLLEAGLHVLVHGDQGEVCVRSLLTVLHQLDLRKCSSSADQ